MLLIPKFLYHNVLFRRLKVALAALGGLGALAGAYLVLSVKIMEKF